MLTVTLVSPLGYHSSLVHARAMSGSQPFEEDIRFVKGLFPPRIFLFLLPGTGVAVLAVALLGFVLYHKA